MRPSRNHARASCIVGLDVVLQQHDRLRALARCLERLRAVEHELGIVREIVQRLREPVVASAVARRVRTRAQQAARGGTRIGCEGLQRRVARVLRRQVLLRGFFGVEQLRDDQRARRRHLGAEASVGRGLLGFVRVEREQSATERR